MKLSLPLFINVILLLNLSQAAKPIARHMVVHVPPGAEAVVELKGYDTDGDPLTATITTLPSTGTLHQLSQVYNVHGYEPKGDMENISTADIVTGSKNRIIYTRPAMDTIPTNGLYAVFGYTVADATNVSDEGLVYLSYTTVTMASSFAFTAEGWTTSGNNGASVMHVPSSRGLLKYYIHASESLVQLSAAGDDIQLWYFNAPASFLGNHWDAYNGYLKFTLGGLVGDFSSTTSLNHAGTSEFIVLDCSTCVYWVDSVLFTGIRLVRRLDTTLTFNGTPKEFAIHLVETSGWLKDSKNVLMDFTVPTTCEFVQVLTSLSAVHILGDFTKGSETVALDTVRFEHGNGQPISCYA